MPRTTSKTSPTTLGLMSKKNRAVSAERPESPPAAKKAAPAGQMALAKVSWAAGPPSLKFPLPDSSHSFSSHSQPNIPLTFNAHNFSKPELQDALPTLRDSLKPEVINMITQAINDFCAYLRNMIKTHIQALVIELKQYIQESYT
ncbi:hypothetical protein MRX96_007697 [Rhipicephalus microplus]